MDYFSVKEVLDNLCICKLLKEEDRRIKNKSKRSLNYIDVFNKDYLDVGIIIKDFVYENKLEPIPLKNIITEEKITIEGAKTMNAQQAKDKFWYCFDNYLKQQNYPFTVCHTKAGINQSAGNINTNNPMDMQTICCEYKYMEQVVLVQVYINNNIPLYDYLHTRKEQLEKELGYPVAWINGGVRSSNVRKIQKVFYLYDTSSYLDVIKEVFPCIMDFIRVFDKYL